MRGVLTSALLVCVATAVSGCAESDEPNDDQIEEFRSGLGGDGGIGEFPGWPGNGDLTLFFGGHANVPGCDIWDFMSNNVTDAQTPNGDLVLIVNAS